MFRVLVKNNIIFHKEKLPNQNSIVEWCERDTLFVTKVEVKGLSVNDLTLNDINSLEQTLFSMTGGVTISNELSLLDSGIGTKTLTTSNLTYQ